MNRSPKIPAALLAATLFLSGLPAFARDKDNDEKVAKSSAKALQTVPAKVKKRDLISLDATQNALLQEIATLTWREGDSHQISLEDVFDRAAEHNPTVDQAKEKIGEAELKGEQIRRPNFFFLILPFDNAALKRAAEENKESAEALYQAAIQKALLDGAQMYGTLTKAYLAKYVGFQVIQQGKAQLKTNQERFISGEVNRFDVTIAEMTLIDRYQKFLAADNGYLDASDGLAAQLAMSTDEPLVPKSVNLGNTLGVELLNLIPGGMSEEVARKAALKNRPELQALRLQQASLEKLAKVSSGNDKKMLENDIKLLKLELEKAERLAGITARQAYADYVLARKTTELADQQFVLATNSLRQLEISQEAGFSSSKDVLDGQVEWAKAKANAANSMVDYNLSQIQLLYQLGLLHKDTLKEPVRLGTGV